MICFDSKFQSKFFYLKNSFELKFRDNYLNKQNLHRAEMFD